MSPEISTSREPIGLPRWDERSPRIDQAVRARVDERLHRPGDGFRRDEQMRGERYPSFWADEIGLDDSRADGVDADAVLPVIGGDGAHEADDAVYICESFFSARCEM